MYNIVYIPERFQNGQQECCFSLQLFTVTAWGFMYLYKKKILILYIFILYVVVTIYMM